MKQKRITILVICLVLAYGFFLKTYRRSEKILTKNQLEQIDSRQYQKEIVEMILLATGQKEQFQEQKIQRIELKKGEVSTFHGDNLVISIWFDNDSEVVAHFSFDGQKYYYLGEIACFQ